MVILQNILLSTTGCLIFDEVHSTECHLAKCHFDGCREEILPNWGLFKPAVGLVATWRVEFDCNDLQG